jgi:hypothetical protein
MVVKIRFGRGPAVSGRTARNKRIAILTASFLTLISLSCAAFALWRVGNDLEFVAGDFIFPSGLLSHWQVWTGLAVGIQYLAWRLNRYAKNSPAPQPESEFTESPRPDSVIANV